MQPTVLIADNDDGVRALLAEIVAMSGARAVTAADGLQAVDQLERAPIDVLVCDLDMPGLTGPEVLAFASALARPPATVVVSGFLDEATRARLQALPCVRHLLRKPFDILQFLELVRGLLRPAPVRTEAPDGLAVAEEA